MCDTIVYAGMLPICRCRQRSRQEKAKEAGVLLAADRAAGLLSIGAWARMQAGEFVWGYPHVASLCCFRL